jgi:hypothetical protein
MRSRIAPEYNELKNNLGVIKEISKWRGEASKKRGDFAKRSNVGLKDQGTLRDSTKKDFQSIGPRRIS